MTADKRIRVGLFGDGPLSDQFEELARHNSEITLSKVDPKGVMDVDVLVDLTQAADPARGLVFWALRSKTAVVTTNSALISEFGDTLRDIARSNGTSLVYEDFKRDTVLDVTTEGGSVVETRAGRHPVLDVREQELADRQSFVEDVAQKLFALHDAT